MLHYACKRVDLIYAPSLIQLNRDKLLATLGLATRQCGTLTFRKGGRAPWGSRHVGKASFAIQKLAFKTGHLNGRCGLITDLPRSRLQRPLLSGKRS